MFADQCVVRIANLAPDLRVRIARVVLDGLPVYALAHIQNVPRDLEFGKPQFRSAVFLDDKPLPVSVARQHDYDGSWRESYSVYPLEEKPAMNKTNFISRAVLV